MSEIASLTETLEKTIMDYCADHGGGFPMGFLCIVDFADADGENSLMIAKQPGQATHRSIGYATYLDLWFKDDAQRAMTIYASTCHDPDCDNCVDADDEDE
jgi:hypothetical protein